MAADCKRVPMATDSSTTAYCLRTAAEVRGPAAHKQHRQATRSPAPTSLPHYNGGKVSATDLAAHGSEELGVGAGLAQFVEQEFHGFDGG